MSSDIHMQVGTFRDCVQRYLRISGYSQMELADALGLHPKVLSRKLNGSGNSHLTHLEVRRIITVLASWQVINTLDEATYLLELAHLGPTSFSDDEWLNPPLNRLTVKQSRLKIFLSYSHKDLDFLNQLKVQLLPLVRQEQITLWTDGEITPGSMWVEEINRHINEADIILLLVSADFLASDYAYSKEMIRALERHETGEATVIPIILRPVDWQQAPFGKLQALPRDAKTVVSPVWKSLDEAFSDVVQGIQLACDEIQKKHRTNPLILKNQQDISAQQPLYIYRLNNVFVKSGFPHVTFVEREDFGLLKLSLAQPGRGIVIEGPSGVGKTTALKKAIEDIASNSSKSRSASIENNSLKMLSARDPNHRERLKTLPEWHHSTVIIDDFHRLDNSFREQVVDYLKYLADTEPESKKLVIVGIPQSGQALVDISFDVATRIDVYKWGKVKDELILQMIEKGETALNIEFDRRTDIILAASGSLNVAQFLCLYICQKEDVLETQSLRRTVLCDVIGAVSNVMIDLSRKFGESIRRFAAMGGHRDVTCLRLLEELALSDDGFISLPLLKDKKRDLAQGIERFINERWMDRLCQDYPVCMNHLYFDQASCTLVIDDPQLTFYLSKMQYSTMAKAAGKVVAIERRKVFISYSHKDAKWLERIRVHLTPLEREGIIDLWDDTKIRAGMNWREELQKAIVSSTVALVLISANFLASDFIAEHELPQLLLRAKVGGTTVLPLIISPCMFVSSGMDEFQAVNSPENPLSRMAFYEREKLLVKIAEIISGKLSIEFH